MSVESAMPLVDEEWRNIKGELLEGFDLQYPGEAICFSPAEKTLSEDGASVRLADFALLFDNLRGAKTPGAADRIAIQGSVKLLRNGSAPAFPDRAQTAALIYVKFELPGLPPEGYTVPLAGYVLVPTGASVGPLCYSIAKEYKCFLENAKTRKDVASFSPGRYPRIKSALLYEVVLTDEEMDGLCVWKARIRHDD